MGDLFQIEDAGGPTVAIRNVPIFRTHSDRQYQCDAEWLDRCCADFHAQKAASLTALYAGGNPDRAAILPTLTIGHTSSGIETPASGFIDNLRRQGEFLYADFVDVPRGTYQEIKANKYPHRSVEVFPSKHRLANVALLGGNYPHLALPLMRFAERFAGGPSIQFAESCTIGGEQAVRYFLEDSSMIPNNNGGQQPAAGGAPNPQLQQLAQQLAPIVAQLIGQQTANSPQGPMANAGAYQESTPRRRYADEPCEPKAPAEPKADKEKETPMDDEKTKSALAEVKAELEQYKASNAKLSATVDELMKHRQAEAQSAKLTMYTMQLKQVLSEGHPIGSLEVVQRHAQRMTGMTPDDAQKYVDDLKASAPKVSITRQTYQQSELLARPGSDGDPERYAADPDNAVNISLGITHDISRIADLIGTGSF